MAKTKKEEPKVETKEKKCYSVPMTEEEKAVYAKTWADIDASIVKVMKVPKK